MYGSVIISFYGSVLLLLFTWASRHSYSTRLYKELPENVKLIQIVGPLKLKMNHGEKDSYFFFKELQLLV